MEEKCGFENVSMYPDSTQTKLTINRFAPMQLKSGKQKSNKVNIDGWRHEISYFLSCDWFSSKFITICDTKKSILS